MNGFQDEPDWHSDTLGPGHRFDGAKVAIVCIFAAAVIVGAAKLAHLAGWW